MIDRADELCDLAREAILLASAVNGIPGTTIEVTCEDDVDIDFSKMPTGQMKAFVSWEKYEDGGAASRGEDFTDYYLTVICVEVCGVARKVPRDWRRVRTAWMQKSVIDVLSNARKPLDGAYALNQGEVAFDLEELTERKAFWCGFSVTLRDSQDEGCT